MLAWLETERPATIEVGDVAEAVGVSREYARTLVARLERKDWLQRLTRGRYEPLLGASGGWPAPDPWAALDGWVRPYYVSFASAAYELGLTPDRPGEVQVATVTGAALVPGMAEMGVRLVRLRRFDAGGVAAARPARAQRAHRHRRAMSARLRNPSRSGRGRARARAHARAR